MMIKEIIIISLIVLVIYLYYQQNNQVDKRSYDALISDLRRQVQHYQTLCQKDKKDAGTSMDINRSEKASQTDLSWQESLKERDQKLADKDKVISSLQTQNKELIQQLQAKNNWGQDNLPQLKKELFNQAINIYQELKTQINKSTIAWGRKEVEKKLEQLEELFGTKQK